MKNPIRWYDGYIKNFIKILIIKYKIFLNIYTLPINLNIFEKNYFETGI